MAKKKHNFDELCAIRDQLYTEVDKESDRGLALVAADYLSNLLEALLRQVFVDDGTANTKEVLDDLFRESGALGSFDIKIRLAYLMGLIGRDTYHALGLIREIRNIAAHSVEPFSLDSPGVRQKCEQLTAWEDYQALAKEVGHPARKHFMFTFWWVLVEIMLRTGRRRHAEVGKEFCVPMDELPDDAEVAEPCIE